jgi:hypothetical protein
LAVSVDSAADAREDSPLRLALSVDSVAIAREASALSATEAREISPLRLAVSVDSAADAREDSPLRLALSVDSAADAREASALSATEAREISLLRLAVSVDSAADAREDSPLRFALSVDSAATAREASALTPPVVALFTSNIVAISLFSPVPYTLLLEPPRPNVPLPPTKLIFIPEISWISETVMVVALSSAASSLPRTTRLPDPLKLKVGCASVLLVADVKKI